MGTPPVNRSYSEAASTAQWAAESLARRYVTTQYERQMAGSAENDACTKHDYLLPPGYSILRPSLASERGVAVFWQEDVPQLRQLFSPSGTINDLLERLHAVIRHNARFPNELELVALEDTNTLGAYPYVDGDNRSYSINVRYKDWQQRQSVAN